MIFFDAERPSDSPFVERVWCSHSEGTHPFLSIAVSRLELVVTNLQGKRSLTVRGPETRTTPVEDCPAEGEWVGILLAPGVFLPQLPARSLVDDQVHLPAASETTFWLGVRPGNIPPMSRPRPLWTGWCRRGCWCVIPSSRRPSRDTTPI